VYGARDFAAAVRPTIYAVLAAFPAVAPDWFVLTVERTSRSNYLRRKRFATFRKRERAQSDGGEVCEARLTPYRRIIYNERRSFPIRQSENRFEKSPLFLCTNLPGKQTNSHATDDARIVHKYRTFVRRNDRVLRFYVRIKRHSKGERLTFRSTEFDKLKSRFRL